LNDLSRYYTYLRMAAEVVESFDGGMPLSLFLKGYFARNKQAGGRDRKAIAGVCYNYYRVGHLLRSWPLHDALIAACLLVDEPQADLVKTLKPEWANFIELDFYRKAEALGIGAEAENLFSYGQLLSQGLFAAEMGISMLKQPRLFLRMRPGRREHVLQQLLVQGIDYAEPFEGCLSLLNATPVHSWLAINRDVVVQDASSQQMGAAIRRLVPGAGPGWRLWDCCAASGGKSIMLHDLFGITEITVSDIRSSILHNLKMRFAQAGMPHPKLVVTNLEEATFNNSSQFDLVVADVPCTGSGTWARTPEQLFYFDSAQLAAFGRRQYAIAKNAYVNLRPGGYMAYITCSVFAAENEDIVNEIVKSSNAYLIDQSIISGVSFGADSMFIAVLKKQD